MSKWFSEDASKMIDLSKVESYNYFDRSYLQRRDLSEGYDPIANAVKSHSHYLVLRCSGVEYTFYGQEALDICSKLSSRRSVI